MAQISLYIEDRMADRLNGAARLKNCSVSKYVAALILERFSEDDEEEARKKMLLRKLRGAIKGNSVTEPQEIPWETEICRRFDLI